MDGWMDEHLVAVFCATFFSLILKIEHLSPTQSKAYSQIHFDLLQQAAACSIPLPDIFSSLTALQELHNRSGLGHLLGQSD